MKRFLLSVCAVLVFAVAPSSAANSKTEYQTVMLAFDAGDHAGALHLLETMDTSRLNDSQVAYLNLVWAKIQLKSGYKNRALANFTEYLNSSGVPALSDTEKSWGYRGQAECYLALGQYALGLKAIDKAIALESARRSIFIKARIQFNLGDFEDVVSLLDEGTPKKASYWNLKGLAQIEMSRFPNAIKTLEQATTFDNPPAYVWNNLATAFLRLDALDYAQDWKTSTVGLRRALDALDKAVELGSTKAKATRVKAEEALAKRSQ